MDSCSSDRAVLREPEAAVRDRADAAEELQRIRTALGCEGRDSDVDPVAVIDMLRSWEVDASIRADRLAAHLRNVLEIARTWEPSYATKMDRDTLAYAAEEIGSEPPQAASGCSHTARSDGQEMFPRCTEKLRAAGKAYPRTCAECGLGPCRAAKSAEQGATPPAPAAPLGERDQWDFGAWLDRLMALADNYYETGSTSQARARVRAALLAHARQCATGWRARSALAASPQPAAPEGWKLVPIEATPEMVKAYLRANDAYWHRTDALPDKLGVWRQGTPTEATAESYRAMLAVAPAAEGGAS